MDDPIRRQILDLLKSQPEISAGDIAAHFNISKPSISHHLDLLKRADLVLQDKRGQFVFYRLNTTVLDELIKWLITLKNSQNT